MALYRAQITIPMDSGLPEDAATNTLYFDADTEGDLDDVHDALSDFYIAIDGLYSSLVDGLGVVVNYYRMSDPEPRTPVKTNGMLTWVTDSSASPTEVALVLSYQAAKISGLPQSRRRGRIYIGPLGGGLSDRPNAVGQINPLVAAAQGLLDASTAATTWTWAQYSPTNNEGANVVSGWVDNEWDTQRRRGRAATSRTAFN